MVDEKQKNEIVKSETKKVDMYAPMPEEIENVLVNGDLKSLAPAQRVEFYNHLCKSLGLNPATKPFDYIVLNGKLTLYANKSCAEQLRKIYGVSVTNVKIDRDTTTIRVMVQGHDKTGRTDVELGIVSLLDKYGKRFKGDALVNAEMKALTKAKRRLTFSLCGLGFLDETEIETIPEDKVQKVKVDIVSGEMENTQPEPKEQHSEASHEPAEMKRYEIPVCPICGTIMTIKAGQNGHCFWGCPLYPDCDGTVEILPSAKQGETTRFMQRYLWENALAQKGGDMAKAKKMLQEDYGLDSLKNTAGIKLGKTFEKMVSQQQEDASALQEGLDMDEPMEG